MSDEKKSVSKTRNWTTVLYPESCAPDWPEILEHWKIRALASPVHDKDKTKDGELKKPHVHLMLLFPGSKTRDCVQRMIEPLKAVGLEPIHDVARLARYLTHMDDPEKAQYDPKCVKAFGGVDYEALVKKGAAREDKEDLEIMCEIMDWCDENVCFSFAKLMRYARKENQSWFKVLCSSKHNVIYNYLRSCAWTEAQEEARRVERENVKAELAEKDAHFARAPVMWEGYEPNV